MSPGPPPGIAGTWLKELDAEKGQIGLLHAIPKLRDELTGVMMDRHRGNDRNLAMALARLDEAHHWVLNYLESQGAILIMPRQEILQAAYADTTDKTVPEGVPHV